MIIDFYNFIYQRQLIWHKKGILKLDPPWTDDKILSTYKFCCPYRENDTCSQHLIYHVITNDNLTLQEKIFNIILYRRFNTKTFFIDYGVQNLPFNFDKILGIMEVKKQYGEKFFNEAYTICQIPYNKNIRPKEKHYQHLLLIKDCAQETSWRISEPGKHTPCILHNFIKKHLPLTGDFLAYQYLIDLSYLKEIEIENINSWCDVGPGAIATIDLLFGKQKSKHEYMMRCIELYKIQGDYLKEDWLKIAYDSPYNPKPILSLNNIEQCLCEYRKWHNLSNNIGRKRYYKQGEQKWISKNANGKIT